MNATFAAVDWGTSSFRLWLLDSSGAVLAEKRSDDGMKSARRDGFPVVLESNLNALCADPVLPVVACGMVGARQGWAEAGYVDTPASLKSVPGRAVRVPGSERAVWIMPGVAQRVSSVPDVMRGEETQLLGAFGADSRGEVLACMPGTHSKWVRLREGTVEEFATFMTGDLFGAVTRETILAHAVAEAGKDEDRAAFRSAVVAAYEQPGLAANLLFRVRSEQLLHGIAPASARERISGTLVGAEITGGVLGGVPPSGIVLVASGRMGALYQAAFEALAIRVRVVDADAAVLEGLSQAARILLDIKTKVPPT